MNWGYLGVVVAVLAIVLISGCTQLTGDLQGKYKWEDPNNLCDNYGSDRSKLLANAAVYKCTEVCGSTENYSSYDCSGKYFTCYCVQDPAIVSAKEAEALAQLKEDVIAQAKADACRFYDKESCETQRNNSFFNGKLIICKWHPELATKCVFVE